MKSFDDSFAIVAFSKQTVTKEFSINAMYEVNKIAIVNLIYVCLAFYAKSASNVTFSEDAEFM